MDKSEADLCLLKVSKQIKRLVSGRIHHRRETKLIFVGLCD